MAASLNTGWYRASAQCFSRARQEHLRALGTLPGPASEGAITMYTHACDRGMAPAACNGAFRFDKSSPEPYPLGGRGCCCPSALTVSGVWWLARGIELSFALVGHVRVDPQTKQVGWSLPVSKRDPAALGVERIHRCCCEDLPEFRPACPYHVTVAHLDALKATFSRAEGDDWRKLPFLPSMAGAALSREATIAAIRATIARAGEPHRPS